MKAEYCILANHYNQPNRAKNGWAHPSETLATRLGMQSFIQLTASLSLSASPSYRLTSTVMITSSSTALGHAVHEQLKVKVTGSAAS